MIQKTTPKTREEQLKDEIMKTKIRTFIGLVALGIIGFTSINATAGNSDFNAYTTVENEENLTIEAWMVDNNLWMEKTDTKAENVEAEKAMEIETWMSDEDFFKEAETITASGSDEEVAKYAEKQIALENEKKDK